jgi:hypothetical protein
LLKLYLTDYLCVGSSSLRSIDAESGYQWEGQT